MNNNLKYYKIPLYLYIAFLISGLFLIIIYNKGDLLLAINQQHQPFLDTFFKYWTYLGDGVVFGLVCLLLLFIRFYYFIIGILAAIVQTLLVQLFKRGLFPGLPRPKKFFSENTDLYYIDGIDIHSYHAFPSGHTATAFAVATLLLITFKNRTWGIVLFVTALLAGISRMYLMQHFFIDVYFGSVFGVSSVLLVYYFVDNHIPGMKSNPLWQRSLLSIGRK